MDEIFYNLIYGKRKLVGLNEFDFVEDTDFDVYSYSRFSRPTFKEGKGVRGILTQDGIFVECSYGGHFRTLDWIGDKAFGGIVFYLHDIDPSISGVSADYDIAKLTERQLDWIESHRKYMVPKQLQNIDTILLSRRYKNDL